MYGEREIESGSLICFPNPKNNRDYEISIDFPEFTCKCPFSGYPDFATLRIKYQPNNRVIELKAIKLYLNSFREKKISHEEVTNQMLDDLVEAAEPKWMQLEADFNPRGNVQFGSRNGTASSQRTGSSIHILWSQCNDGQPPLYWTSFKHFI